MEQAGAITRAQIDQMKDRMFVAEYRATATDDEAIGIAVSQFLEWDGSAIIRAFHNALEDANFHTEAGEIQERYRWAFPGKGEETP